jgi:hypothetical protein
VHVIDPTSLWVRPLGVEQRALFGTWRGLDQAAPRCATLIHLTGVPSAVPGYREGGV